MRAWHLDPFLWFCVFAIVVPPIWVGHSLQEAIAYFSCPYMVAFVAATAAVPMLVARGFFGATPASESLSEFEVWRARWFLLNGLLIHAYLDGMIGGYKCNPTLAAQYAKLDKRYADATSYGVVLHAISVLELAVYMPLCVWLYVAFHKGKAYRASLEVLCSAFQLFGTLIYVMQEHYTGYKSFMVDYKLSFSIDHLFYFWFAVVMGIAIWIVIPVWLIVVALGETQTVCADGTVARRSASPVAVKSGKSSKSRAKKN